MAVLTRIRKVKIPTFVSLAVFLLASCFFSPPAHALSAPEYEVKAAFLYNFAKFIEWPPGTFHDENSPINLCLTDGSSFRGALEAIQGKTVKGRKIAIRTAGTDGTAACQILFIPSSDMTQVGEILDSVKSRGILTVGEEKGFAQLGGIISFVLIGNKISFEINIDAAKRSGLEISSQLLKLAIIVRDKP